MITQWPNRLSLAQVPTPLQPLNRLSKQLGGPTIWVKRDDLTGSVLSGNKVRKLEFTLARAIDNNSKVLITCGGLQSNHCRATAFLAAQLGLKAHLVLRGETNNLDGNLLLDYLAGAEITMVPKENYQKNLNKILEETADIYRQQGLNPTIIPTGASDGVGVWGYLAAYAELQKDFVKHNIEPAFIICATGSGGTQAGLTLGQYLTGANISVVGMAVCDDAKYFRNKVMDDIQDFYSDYQQFVSEPQPTHGQINIQTNDRYIGAGYGLASDEVLECIAQVASTEGLLLDPVYSGKAFYGMLEEIKLGHYQQAKDIVFVHTGGSFGVFPYKEQFQQSLL